VKGEWLHEMAAMRAVSTFVYRQSRSHSVIRARARGQTVRTSKQTSPQKWVKLRACWLTWSGGKEQGNWVVARRL